MTLQSCGHDFDPALHERCPECGRVPDTAGSAADASVSESEDRPDVEVIGIDADGATAGASNILRASIKPAPGASEEKDSKFVGDAALARLTEVLDSYPDVPTIVVIGDTSVGKTFYVRMITALAIGQGYQWTPTKIVPAADSAIVREEKVATASSPQERQEAQRTRTVTIHLLARAEQTEGPKASRKAGPPAFRLIDMPGEFIAEAMKTQFQGELRSRERMIFPCLAASQGIVLLIPAPHVFNPSRSGVSAQAVKDAVELAVGVRLVCNLLEVQDSAAASVAPAITAFLNLSPEERSRRGFDDKRPCGKPFMTLLAQADVVFRPGRQGRKEPTEGEWPREDDPMGSTARKIRGLINGLSNAFEVFRVDYLTAAEGYDADTQSINDLTSDTPNLGVWSSVMWMLSQIEGRRLRGLRPQRRAGFAWAVPAWAKGPWRWVFQGHFREADAHQDGWVIAARERHDPDFKHALNPDHAEES